MNEIAYRTVDVDGLGVFYREAGAADAPTLLLLHGFPSVEPHVPRPDPGAGRPLPCGRARPAGLRHDRAAGAGQFAYTFDTSRGDRSLHRGARSRAVRGLRVRLWRAGRLPARRAHPERITAIVTQNGNAYVEGAEDGWSPIQAYWQEPTQANRAALRGFLAPETTLLQYTHGVADPTLVVARRPHAGRLLPGAPGQRRDPARPPARLPVERRALPDVPGLFAPASAAAARGVGQATTRSSSRPAPRRSSATCPTADIRFFDTGHFALETHAREIGAAMRDFLGP